MFNTFWLYLCLNHWIFILLHPTHVSSLYYAITNTPVSHTTDHLRFVSVWNKLEARQARQDWESREKTHYIRKIRKEQYVKKANRGQQRVQCITLCKANAPWGWDLDFQSSGILAKNHSQAGPLPPWVLTATSQPWPAADGTKNNIRQRKGSNYDCLEIGIHILNYYQPDSKINTQSQPEIGQSLPGLGRVAKEMEIINRMKWNRETDYITANECTSKGSLYVIWTKTNEGF